MMTDCKLPRVSTLKLGRVCPKCKQDLPWSAFPGIAGNDPKRRKCWDCERESTRARVATERGKMLACNRNRVFRAKNPSGGTDYQRSYRETHKSSVLAYNQSRSGSPEVVARATLNDELRAGRITKPERCERCNTLTPSRRLHGHHHDYSTPLDVVWVCASCHGLEHRI